MTPMISLFPPCYCGGGRGAFLALTIMVGQPFAMSVGYDEIVQETKKRTEKSRGGNENGNSLFIF